MFKSVESLSSEQTGFPEHIEESKESGERKSFLEDFYSQQGITVKTSEILVDKLKEIKTNDAEFAKLNSLFEEKQRVFNEALPTMSEKREISEERKLDKLRARIGELAEIRKYYYEHGYAPDSRSFYATSSDSIEVLRKVDVRGQHVSTVAGSSDFWQIFAEGGAEEIDVFDISLPAIFYAELKLVGLENLSFEEYIKMFGKSADDLKSRGADFFDWDIYKRIRDKLSSQAAVYFDGLLKHKKILFTYEEPGIKDFVRFREESPFIGGTISTAQDYEKLKSTSKKIKYKFFLKDINRDPQGEEMTLSDAVYLSNIGYGFDDSLKLAAEIISGGVKKVITSTSENGLSKYLFRISKEKRKEITGGTNLGTFDGIHVTVLGVGKQREVGQIILEMVGD